MGGHLEAKITDLGVAKVVKADGTSTMTKIPGTPDFMPPEALAKKPVYGPSLDIFSYGGLILNVVTQQWPEPTNREQLNVTTDKWEVISEVSRRQNYFDMFTENVGDLKKLATLCLSDNPNKRPTVVQVSTEIQSAKDKSWEIIDHEGISPYLWWAEVTGQQQVI